LHTLDPSTNVDVNDVTGPSDRRTFATGKIGPNEVRVSVWPVSNDGAGGHR
jgi:hypothetical protein